MHFVELNIYISIQMFLKCVSEGLSDNKPAMVQVMAWQQTGDKPLSEPMMAKFSQWCHMASSGWSKLTHCELVTPYGDIKMGQHWLRQWLGAWWHQTIACTNVDISLMGSLSLTDDREWSRYQYMKWVSKIHIYNSFHISQSPMS